MLTAVKITRNGKSTTKLKVYKKKSYNSSIIQSVARQISVKFRPDSQTYNVHPAFSSHDHWRSKS